NTSIERWAVRGIVGRRPAASVQAVERPIVGLCPRTRGAQGRPRRQFAVCVVRQVVLAAGGIADVRDPPAATAVVREIPLEGRRLSRVARVKPWPASGRAWRNSVLLCISIGIEKECVLVPQLVGV